jgi:hypothetical protein
VNGSGRGARLLLPLACAAGAIALGASEFMNTFALRPPGGETEQLLGAGDRHAYALLILAVFALVALGAALYTGSKPAAIAVALCGGLALLIFLIVDLPDAGNIGTLNNTRENFIDAKAYPVSGFYLSLIGAAVLALCGAALATLSPEQLRLRKG